MPKRTDRAPTKRGAEVHPLTFAEFARRCKRGRSRVSEALKGPLAPAVMTGGRINAAHPAARAWAEERGISAAELLGVSAVAAAAPAPAQSPLRPIAARVAPSASTATLLSEHDVSPNDERLLQMTLGDVVERYGSIQGFADHVDVVKKMHEIERIELQNSETRGELVERALVQKVFGALDGANRKMLLDAPRTIARRLAQDVDGGASTEAIEQGVRELLTKALDGVKLAASGAVAGAGGDAEE